MPKHILMTRFNSRNKEDSVTRRCVLSPEWWPHITEIVLHRWLPLVKRLDVDEIVVPFAPIIPHKYYYELRKIMEEKGIRVLIEYDEEVQLGEPVRWLQGIRDDVVLINLDSDDVVLPEYVQAIRSIDFEEGMVAIARNGYIYQAERDLLGNYRHMSSQFFVEYFPEGVLKSRQSIIDYMNKFKMNTYHHRLSRVEKVEILPKNLFMMREHGHNVSADWDDDNTQGHIRGVIEGKEKRDILDKFYGLTRNQKLV